MITTLLGLRFVLELCLLAALAYVGWQIDGPLVLRLLAALALPTLAAVVWGLVVSPRARVAAPLAVRLAVEMALFALAVVGLWWAGAVTFAVVLGIAEVVVLAALLASGRPPGPTD